MNDVREKEIEFFIKTFKNIVKSHKDGINGAEEWPKPSPYISDITSKVSNPNFKVQVSILKKLFFNDLLFHYYDLCYRMNDKFAEMNNICIQKLDKILELLIEVREVKKLPGNDIDWYLLDKLTSEEFNILDLFNKLKIIVCKNLKLEEFKIEKIFIIDLWMILEITISFLIPINQLIIL